MNPSVFRKFLFFKMPIAWIAGLRLKKLDNKSCIIGIKLSKFSQNPFKSMFWAVQGMAAELSSGVLCITKIQETKQRISMLVIEQNAKFYKKAVGKIAFTCNDGDMISETIKKAIETKQGETLVIKSKGIDESGDVVSEFEFTWSFKVKG